MTPVDAALLVVGLCAFVALLAVPSWTLPSIAFVSFALVPVKYISPFQPNGSISLGMIVIVIWALRFPWRTSVRRYVLVVPAVLCAVWLVLAVLLSEVRSTSAFWSTDFVILVLLPCIWLPFQPRAVAALTRTWLWTAGALGVYACLEAFVLHSNPIFDGLYQSAPEPLDQTWTVWRATTSLGHPLVNGTFFAISAIIALGCALDRGRLRSFEGAVTLACVGGVFASASRGASFGLALGLLALLAVRQRDRGQGVRRRSVALVVVIVPLLALGSYVYLGSRSSSNEGIASSQVRDDSISIGLTLAREHAPLGVGPGLADQVKAQSPSVDPTAGIENSWLQIAVSQGVPGIVLIAWLVFAGIGGSRHRRPYFGAAVIGYVVCAAGYNLLEAQRPALLVLGLLLGAAVTDVEDVRATPPVVAEPEPIPELVFVNFDA